MAVLQSGLRAEVEIVGNERGGGDILWSGLAVGDCSSRMASEEGVSCYSIVEELWSCVAPVVDRIVLFFRSRQKKNKIHRITPFFGLRAKQLNRVCVL